MSIAEQLALIPPEIERFSGARDDIASAIIAKGVSVPSSAKIDALATYVANIATSVDGKGTMFGRKFETGTFTPTSNTKSISNLSHSLGVIPTGLVLWIADSTLTEYASYNDALFCSYTWYFDNTFMSGIVGQGRYGYGDLYVWTNNEYWSPTTSSTNSSGPIIRKATTNSFSVYSVGSGNGDGYFWNGWKYNYILFGSV